MEPEDEAFEELALKQGHWQYASGWRKKQIMETSMTDKEAMKLALDALEHWDVHGKLHQPTEEAITALKKRLADPMREVQRLGQEIEQEPVAVKRMKEWVEFLKRQSDNGQHMNIPSSFGAGTCWELAIELEQFINTISPQRTEQNFCSRCGKRTLDLTHIHTCTPPPQEKT